MVFLDTYDGFENVTQCWSFVRFFRLDTSDPDNDDERIFFTKSYSERWNFRDKWMAGVR